MSSWPLAVGAVAAVLAAGACRLALGETRGFVPPPRTIADITAILDQEKPDAAAAARRAAEADASPPSGAGDAALAQFYVTRGQARSEVGRIQEAIADLEQSLAINKEPMSPLAIRTRQMLIRLFRQAGEAKRALPLLTVMTRQYDRPGSFGRLFSVYRWQVLYSLMLGDINTAEASLQRAQALLKRSQNWPNTERFRAAWEAQVEDMLGRVLETRGRYSAAEAAFRRSGAFWIENARTTASWPVPPPRVLTETPINFARAYEGRTKMRQGRHAEGEADIRQALLSHLKNVGKYNPDTPLFINFLAKAILEQGRYKEAEQLARASVEIFEGLGYRDDAQPVVGTLALIVVALNLQQKFQEERIVLSRIDAAVKDWVPDRVAALGLDGARAYMEFYTGNIETGISIARNLADRTKARFGEKHFDHAIARGIFAVGLTRARRDEEALREFRAAMPALFAASRANEDDEQGVIAARDHRMAVIVEHYMVLLARMHSASTDAAAESFRLADAIRGHSVQKALSASTARASVSDPALAALVRQEQDLAKQVQALVGTLNNTLSLPPEERDQDSVRALNAEIEKARAERNKSRQEIGRRFPSYVDLIDPKPPTVGEIKASLRPGEAMLSFYFGRRFSFVWAVPRDGAVAFAMITASPHDIDNKIRVLRASLEPQAAMISEIPPFDLRLAHELYTLLLRPVESSWKRAKSLVVVTNGALGLLPLGLLPVEPAELKTNGGPPFAGYRDVAWLVRTHAVSMIPSAAALRTLRQLPAGSNKRERLIGFGDPLFSARQAGEAQQASVPVRLAGADLRGMPLGRRTAPQTLGVDSAELGMLPRLPDTADELRSIAIALQADPAKVLHLGKAANERAVKSAPLSKYRIVAFATHGLVPGELNGLTQPALALTAPEVADVDGDGLLTMEEILALKLDADWVLLSACNTGAGAGAGAEAASGLGRAFFYAGTRALLVTNWSVHSQSARELVTDLFRRQAADPAMTRAEALRQAMLSLLDGKGFTDEAGKTLYTYGHPLFWAPYTIIGDGGGQ